jgi:hypothetical protein
MTDTPPIFPNCPRCGGTVKIGTDTAAEREMANRTVRPLVFDSPLAYRPRAAGLRGQGTSTGYSTSCVFASTVTCQPPVFCSGKVHPIDYQLISPPDWGSLSRKVETQNRRPDVLREEIPGPTGARSS